MSNDGRYKHMSKIHRVPNYLSSASKKRLSMLRSTGFGAFTQMCQWNGFPESFVKWVCQNFESENCQIRLNNLTVLPIKCKDIKRVYNLPNSGKKVDLSKCTKTSVQQLRKEFEWELNAKDHKVLVTMMKSNSMEVNQPLFRTESFGYTYHAEQQKNYTSMMEKRQLFLRSYQFTRKKTFTDRIKGSLVRVKKVVWLRLRSARRFRRRLGFSVFRIKFTFCCRNHHQKYRKTDHFSYCF